MKINTGLILALAAGGVATAADDFAPQVRDYKVREAGYDGFVYHLGTSGERIVISAAGDRTPINPRGSAAWQWDQSVVDPCVPDTYDPEDGLVIAVDPTTLGNEAQGDAQAFDGIAMWHDWFQAPGDTIISGISFASFAQIVDTDADGNGVGDGVEGLDWILVFTEDDRASDRSGALAHSPIIIESLAGSLDVGATDGVAGDGLISFQEGQVIINFIDLTAGDTPTDIEVADTNDMSDGAFGEDSIFSDIDGVDATPDDGTYPVGVGLFDCGYVVHVRQPNVAEGDPLILRFPGLAGIDGFENPDPVDLSTFPNILPVGNSLVAPSEDETSYGTNPWPVAGYTPVSPEGVGTWDAQATIDVSGADIGAFFYGGFACLSPAPAEPPFWDNPYTGYDISFNIDRVGGGEPDGCNDADIAEPFDVLDLADIGAFVTAFQSGGADADIAAPFGVFDLADIGAFVQAFQAGCP